MSIERFGDCYVLDCDGCGGSYPGFFDDFYEAVAFKKDKENGWSSVKTKDGWQDYCPECTEERNGIK